MKLSLSKDLAPFKEEAKRQINAKRDEFLKEGMIHKGIRVRGTQSDYSYLMIMKLKADLYVVYHDANNVDHELNISEFADLVKDYEDWYNAIYQASWEVKADIDNATSPAEIDNIVAEYK